MIMMDLKGITWVGHVYQKFEALCLEVEETMYEDTVNYVENQVQTVGASVKRFYSDVMQDLLPPSSDTVKTAAEASPSSDTSPKSICSTCRKPNVALKVETMNVADQKLTKDSVLAADATNDGLYNDRSMNRKTDIQLGTVKPSGKVTYATDKVPSSHPIENDWPDFLESDCDDSEHPLMAKSSAAEKGMQCASSIGAQGALNGGFRDLNAFYPKASSSNGDEERNADQVALGSPSGQSDDGKLKEVECERETGGIQQCIDTIREVDGGLVMVNAQELGLHPEVKVQRKRRTYKKKIRDAISTRMRSARKKEYQQLAAWQEENEHQGHELEWELL